jgi:16S rRNA (cytosine1402-N4)-methyltransferase
MSVHIPVLMDEVLEGLDLLPNDIVIDGTINGGGHAYEISKILSKKGILIGSDQDSTGLAVSEERLTDALATIHLVHGNTRNITEILEGLGIEQYDKLLLDLGWSSNQFENPKRGFSFMHDGPLTMTLSDNPETAVFTAHDIINDWAEESLMDIIQGYGEERYAWKIVQAILKYRSEKTIEGTLELAEIIASAVSNKYRNGPIHPATKTFQALRIAVNDEMGALKQIMEDGFKKLAPKGRMVIISFHSVEDRIVKQYFKQKKQEGVAEIITKKPLTASDAELLINRRSRSAKLRIIQKL